MSSTPLYTDELIEYDVAVRTPIFQGFMRIIIMLVHASILTVRQGSTLLCYALRCVARRL
jgi:hypothetical protein